MDTLEYTLLVVLCINLMLVLGSFSALNVNPNFNSAEGVINCKTSPLGQYGNCSESNYSIDTSAPTLPTSSTSVDATTGNVFTDIYNTIKGFFADTLGLKYVVAVVGAPTTFMKGAGLDPVFSSLVGAVWWIFTVLVIITFLKR